MYILGGEGVIVVVAACHTCFITPLSSTWAAVVAAAAAEG